MNLLKGLKLKGRVLYNEPLCRHTTFKIGGPARIWAEPEGMDDLTALLEISKTESLPIFLVGEGSNILVSDEGLDVIAVSLKGSFDLLKILGEKIICGAGYRLQKFILSTIGAGYSGLEFMAGIPGTVGGAVRMNAGGPSSGPWISNFLNRLEVLDSKGAVKYIEKKDFRFGYRESNLDGFIILQAEFNLRSSPDKDFLIKEYKRFLDEKKNKQDLSTPSAGCVFKNPKRPSAENLTAARLIEECGLKGKRIGDAMISAKHANFIVNLKRAAFNDVISLIDLVKEAVFKKYNINLETEIEILR